MPEPAIRPPLEDVDDAVLASRAADGDVRAFDALVRRYGRLVRAYARRVLGSSADVDDVAQDTFVTAWQQLPTLTDPASVRGWLLRIASRKAIDRVRSRKTYVDVDDVDVAADAAETPDRIVEASSRQEALRAALSRMPAEQARCWVLKEYAAYSYQDIADDLGVPVSTVRGLLSRARKHLVAAMEGWR